MSAQFRLRFAIRFAFLLALWVTFALPAAAAASDGLAGVWEGAIDLGGAPLAIIAAFEQDGGGNWTGSIDIPAQGAFGIPLEEIRFEDGQVSFRMQGVPGEPTFAGAASGGVIAGAFSQSGMEFPFELTKTAAEPGGDASQSVYRDPRGLFSMPIPTNWSVAMEDPFLQLTDPDGSIRISVVVLPLGGDAEEGAEDALVDAVRRSWAAVDPEFALEPGEVTEVPMGTGADRAIVASYQIQSGTVYEAIAQSYEGAAYTILMEGELAALQRRLAQAQVAVTGFKILAIAEDDISGLAPRQVAEVLPEFTAYAEELMARFGVPGAVIGVAQGGEIAYLGAFGVRNAATGEPMQTDTHLMIGSTGKTMSTLLLAALIDEGLAQWTTPAAELLPGFAVADPELSRSITLQHLLCACSGVPRRDAELFFHGDSITAEEMIATLSTFEFFTEFGEAFQYSNQLVATAGYAAAAADGARYGGLFEGYATSLRRRVLGPIGMDDTTLAFDQVLAEGRHAAPHRRDLFTGEYAPIDVDIERFLLPVAPAGAHWSTAEDMAKYLLTQLNLGVAPNGRRVVSEENLLATWQPRTAVAAAESYGLGWFTGQYKGLRTVYHAGNTLGFTSEFYLLPEADLGAFVITNAAASNAFNGAVIARLLELLYDLEDETSAYVSFNLQQIESSLAELQEVVRSRTEAEWAAGHVGEYWNDSLGRIRLSWDAGRLELAAGNFTAELRPLGKAEDEAFTAYLAIGGPIEGAVFHLERGEDGEPVIRLGEGALVYRFTPAPGPRSQSS